MMREVLDLVEIARIDHQETDCPAQPLVEPFGREYRAVAQFMLACIQEVQQDAVDHEYRDRNPGAPGLPQQIAAERDCAEVRAGLHQAAQVGALIQCAQMITLQQLAAGKFGVHRVQLSFRFGRGAMMR